MLNLLNIISLLKSKFVYRINTFYWSINYSFRNVWKLLYWSYVSRKRLSMGEENKKKLFARIVRNAFTLKAVFPSPLKENSSRNVSDVCSLSIVSAVPSLKVSLKSVN